MNINLKKNVLECQIYYYKFYKKFTKNIQFFKGEFLFKEKFQNYNSMNNNLTFIYNKVYKTEAAMKKAKTMDAKRASKQAKREAYAVSEKAFKRQKTDFSKQLLNIGSIYNEEKKKEIKINKEEKIRERKKNEKGQALGSFKIVYYHDNLYIKKIIEIVDNETF